MSSPLRLRFFAHSWRSDWNHGNAHFLRGLVTELMNLGHEVRCYEAANSWSFVNLMQEGCAAESLLKFQSAFPNLMVRTYPKEAFDHFAAEELRDADVVILHEWTASEIVFKVLALRQRYGFRLLFHDSHHRSYTKPQEIAELRVREFDGVLAFGEAIRRLYLELFAVPRAWTFHEAADTARFFPIAKSSRNEINWIGNWGDDERTRELQEFLIEPLASVTSHQAAIYGVRYPEAAKAQLRNAGISYRGYLPNLSAPNVYSRSALTLHVPRRCYANGLSGIPTIRMFEAFACGVPLLCSPWVDTEGLFRADHDFICVPDGAAMKASIAELLQDDEVRRQLSANALQTIVDRHTCRHRAEQLVDICEELGR
jgi:spore maturation protein CgeB